MMIIKPTDVEISFTSANTVYDAKLVRIYAAANSVVTIVSTENANTSFTMHQGTIEILEKLPSDTIAGTTTLRCTPVSYKY
jgi:hypothetical protein